MKAKVIASDIPQAVSTWRSSRSRNGPRVGRRLRRGQLGERCRQAERSRRAAPTSSIRSTSRRTSTRNDGTVTLHDVRFAMRDSGFASAPSRGSRLAPPTSAEATAAGPPRIPVVRGSRHVRVRDAHAQHALDARGAQRQRQRRDRRRILVDRADRPAAPRRSAGSSAAQRAIARRRGVDVGAALEARRRPRSSARAACWCARTDAGLK